MSSVAILCPFILYDGCIVIGFRVLTIGLVTDKILAEDICVIVPKGRKMNAHAHLAGQITNQMSNQVSGPPQQIGNYMAPQMQSLGPRPVDSELQDARITMQHKM